MLTVIAPMMKRSSSQVEPPLDAFPGTRSKRVTTLDDVANTPDLDYAPNTLDDETHTRMDSEVMATVGAIFQAALMGADDNPEFLAQACSFLLATIVSTSESLLDPRNEKNQNAKALLAEYPNLATQLIAAWREKTFKDIRNLQILRNAGNVNNQIDDPLARDESTVLPAGLSEEATVKSWSFPYRGHVAEVLYDYQRGHNIPHAYAHLIPIVNSSGMGKSRTIDEFSKDHFVIPFNLQAGNQGYPAPDFDVRDWFLKPGYSPQENDNRYSAFLTALFQVTLEVISHPDVQIRQRISECLSLKDDEKRAALQDYPASLAGQFRLFMTIGQTFSKQGALRIEFYDKVLRKADQLYGQQGSRTPTWQKTPSGKFATGDPQRPHVDILAVTQQLLEKICPGFERENKNVPVLTLAFDEASSISERPADGSPSKFSSLRRAFRGLRPFPVWSFFLSTTGKFDQFSPAPHMDDSSRIFQATLVNVAPFVALGFDHLAEKFKADGSFSLERVSSLEYRLSLGRPLWLTRYLQGGGEIRSTIILFAIEKLLCCAWRAKQNLAATVQEQFAVMSHRLVLDFNTNSCTGQNQKTAEKNQMVQVEKHMRVRLGVREGFESVVTVAPSEPALAEAAATVMQHEGFSSCRALSNILTWPGMSKGDRGELIATNIIIDTLDSLMFKDGLIQSLVVKTTSFVDALLAPGIYRDKIRNAMPSHLRQKSDDQTFAQTFRNSRLYVMHFVKVYDSSVLTPRLLLRMAARGAAIQCMDNQAGVDLVLPALRRNTTMTNWNLSPMFFQIKNHLFYQTPGSDLFDRMEPTMQSILGENHPPIIRMVFALAAHESDVQVMSGPERRNPARQCKYSGAPYRDGFTSFDIWCGSASSSTFGAIRREDNSVYQDLLRRSKQVPEMFEGSASIKEVLMSMYPGATAEPGHWSAFCDLDSSEDQPPGAAVEKGPEIDAELSLEEDSANDEESNEAGMVASRASSTSTVKHGPARSQPMAATTLVRHRTRTSSHKPVVAGAAAALAPTLQGDRGSSMPLSPTPGPPTTRTRRPYRDMAPLNLPSQRHQNQRKRRASNANRKVMSEIHPRHRSRNSRARPSDAIPLQS